MAFEWVKGSVVGRDYVEALTPDEMVGNAAIPQPKPKVEIDLDKLPSTLADMINSTDKPVAAVLRELTRLTGLTTTLEHGPVAGKTGNQIIGYNQSKRALIPRDEIEVRVNGSNDMFLSPRDLAVITEKPEETDTPEPFPQQVLTVIYGDPAEVVAVRRIAKSVEPENGGQEYFGSLSGWAWEGKDRINMEQVVPVLVIGAQALRPFVISAREKLSQLQTPGTGRRRK